MAKPILREATVEASMGHPMSRHEGTVMVRVLGSSKQDFTPDVIWVGPDPDDEIGEAYFDPWGEGIEELRLDYDQFLHAIGRWEP